MIPKHEKQIIVKCWKCKKPFDVVTAERCFDHLNGSLESSQLKQFLGEPMNYTTKCEHCGACVCHKYDKMKEIDCPVLNKVGLMRVMPSVHKQLTKDNIGILTTPCSCEASTRGLDYIENEETGEILEADFRECSMCKRIWIE